ncbi:hypothetical protein [Vibrio genomosp. F10]|uniref:hypothetical protein n=1 Tax=Vibrio genomosp. F10 TaxID=723171 RepID=UPI000311B314|nr:hypothetical protein [Vibrio genomosp. F10]OEF19909.1 hypothetical protein A1QK_21135 [Vibrio genomosp. F10 str. 9ZD137]
MKVIYTESGSQALENYQSLRKRELEEFLQKEKYVFGDDFVEITATDIKNAEKEITYVKSNRRTSLPLTATLLKVYMFTGFVMVLVGVFYEQIMELIYGGATQQMVFILGGVVLSLVSGLAHYFIQKRDERRAMQKALEIKAKKFETSED